MGGGASAIHSLTAGTEVAPRKNRVRGQCEHGIQSMP